MWLVDDTRSSSGHDQALIRFAVDLGADPSDAVEMVGAVMAYCRSTHGSTDVSPWYLRFLTARAFSPAGGMVPTRDRLLHGVADARPVERMLVMALTASEGPAGLYETYRRALLFPCATALSASGFALQLDLRKIRVTPDADHVLMWDGVTARLAQWIASWRQGNPGMDLVLIAGAGMFLTPADELRGILTGRIRHEEGRCSRPPADIRWLETGC